VQLAILGKLLVQLGGATARWLPTPPSQAQRANGAASALGGGMAT
jgi:hypothetical protein